MPLFNNVLNNNMVHMSNERLLIKITHNDLSDITFCALQLSFLDTGV